MPTSTTPAKTDKKGWYTRGYLPHLDQPGLIQALTFRLHDSVPVQIIDRWKGELALAAATDTKTRQAREQELRWRIARYEDAGHGACWLADQRIGQLVEQALLHFDGDRYHLGAWCIMPNHVHVLIKTVTGYRLDQVVHSWKSYTALQANRLLSRSGHFWARDFYDRYIRDDAHLARAIAYIEQNPVKAGLVTKPEAWPYSSAAYREQKQN